MGMGFGGSQHGEEGVDVWVECVAGGGGEVVEEGGC
jgi:hypothetical protein